MSDGDVAGGINASRHNASTDMCVGVGGSPEGIVTACAIKALGGHIQGRLWPRDDDEKQRGVDAGLRLDGHVYEADELVKGTTQSSLLPASPTVSWSPASADRANTSTRRVSSCVGHPGRCDASVPNTSPSKWLKH